MSFPEIIQALVLLAVFLQSICLSVAVELCQKKSQWRFALEHSQYTSFLTRDYPECLFYCLQDQSHCKSLTYDLMSKNCKLNSKTRWSNPSQYMKKSNNIYKEMLETKYQTTSQASSTSSTASQTSSTPSTASQTSSTPSTASQTSSIPSTASQTSALVSTTPKNIDVDAFCVGRTEGYHDHPYDCKKYIACFYSIPGFTMEHDCASKPSYVKRVCGNC